MRQNILLVAVFGAIMGLTGCPAPKSDTNPTYGTATRGGTTYTLTHTAKNSGGSYLYELDVDDGGADVVSVLLKKVPTKSGAITIGDSAMIALGLSDGTHMYDKKGETITATFSGSKITFSFVSLTETDNFGNAATAGKPLTGSVTTP
jgi:hypothetical protein